MLSLSPLRSWFVRLRGRHCLALERLSVGGILVWIVLAGVLACLVWQPFVSLQRAALTDMRERLAARAQELDAKLGEVAYQVDSQRTAAETLLLHSESLVHSPLN